MNNYEHIKGMTLEEMAIYFADDFHCILCSEYKRLTDNPLTKDDNCDSQCAKHCKEWLENEVEREMLFSGKQKDNGVSNVYDNF